MPQADARGSSTRAVVLVSDRGRPAAGPAHAAAAGLEGDTWRAVAVPPEQPEYVPNELQCAELPDGTVVLNVRS